MRTGMAGADIRATQFLQPCPEAMEKLHQLAANEFALSHPDCRIAVLSAEKKDSVALQFDDLYWNFNRTGNRLNQFGNDGVAVRERLGVSGHVARVTANVGKDQQYRFRGGLRGQMSQLFSSQMQLFPRCGR